MSLFLILRFLNRMLDRILKRPLLFMNRKLGAEL